MSTIKSNNVQVGQSATATQNFTITTGTDGTGKVARGNVGATTQDVITIDAAGKVDFPAGLTAFLGSNQSLTANGYQKFPGGLILQWGTTASVAPDAQVAVTFPIAFPNACFMVIPTAFNSGSGIDNTAAVILKSSTGTTISRVFPPGSAGETNPLGWIAVGF